VFESNLPSITPPRCCKARSRGLSGSGAGANAYVFRDPGPRVAGVPASKSGNRLGTQNQEILMALSAPAPDPDSPLERALQHLGGVIEGRLLSTKGNGQALTT
jgi:hypothetical protein